MGSTCPTQSSQVRPREDQQEMSKIKLTHYNVRGRGETICLVLAYAGKEYEDKRIAPEDMPSLKPTLPFGQLPVLEVDGVIIGQSMAIARFLANQYGIAGSSNLVKAQVDEVVDVMNDVQDAMYGTFFEKDEKVKAEKIKKVKEETIPNSLANLEKVLTARGGQFLAGNSLSWAELHFLQLTESLETMSPKYLDATPKLANLVERTKNLPNIKKWLEERPVTPY